MPNKRVLISAVFFLQGEDKCTNHVHRSIFTATTPVPEQTTNIPSSRPSANAGTKQHNVTKTDDVPEETTGETKLWFLLFLLPLILVIGVVVVTVLRYRRRRRSRKLERKNSRSVEQMRPLMSRRPSKFIIILSGIYFLVLF